MTSRKTLRRPVPDHSHFSLLLSYRTMQNSLCYNHLPCTYMFLPISRRDQILLSCSSEHTSSWHMTFLPYGHQNFPYLRNIPYHLRLQNKISRQPVRKILCGMHLLTFYQSLPENDRTPQIHCDTVLCNKHLSFFVIPFYLFQFLSSCPLARKT